MKTSIPAVSLILTSLSLTSCVLCTPVDETKSMGDASVARYAPIPISADLASGQKLRNVPVANGTSVESTDNFAVVVAGENGNAKNHTAGVAVAGDRGTAINQRYGVAYAPLRGDAVGGAQTVSLSRSGEASSGDGGVSITKNYGGEASVGSWGIAYAAIPGDNNYGKVRGNKSSVLVLAGRVRRQGKLCYVVRVAQVGTWVDFQYIKPNQFYTLNESGRIVKADED